MKRQGDHSQKGAVLVFIALLLPVIVFFAGMAMDFGRAYLHKSSLQNAADAAALAGVTAAAKSGRARLVDSIPSGFTSVSDAGRLAVAKEAANIILLKDTGTASANESNTSLRKTKERLGDDIEADADTYYYMVELNDEVEMAFAQLFLPKSLFPDNWKVQVSVMALAKAWISGVGPDLKYQMDKVAEGNTTSDFYDWEDEIKKLVNANIISLNGKTLRERVQELSFTNKGIKYDEYGNRSEVFDMDTSDAERNNLRDFFINLKQDVHYDSSLTDNFDLANLRDMSYEEARDLFYNDGKKFINVILPDGTFLSGQETWDSVVRKFGSKIGSKNSSIWTRLTNPNLPNHLSWDDISADEREIVWRALTSSINATINVNEAYTVRNVDELSDKEVSLTPQGERNQLDPLFVRIESEEFNKDGIFNTIRDITINIKADNTVKANDEYMYRPMVFVYEGPVDVNGNRGDGRKSNTVVLNLESDFRGIIYAPNSPVQVNGNVNDIKHKFNGFIIAQRIIGPNGEDLTGEMPDEQNENTDEVLQAFYERLGFLDAKYDDFDVLRLNVYNPKKDVVYLTDRAMNTI